MSTNYCVSVLLKKILNHSPFDRTVHAKVHNIQAAFWNFEYKLIDLSMVLFDRLYCNL